LKKGFGRGAWTGFSRIQEEEKRGYRGETVKGGRKGRGKLHFKGMYSLKRKTSRKIAKKTFFQTTKKKLTQGGKKGGPESELQRQAWEDCASKGNKT